MWDNEKLLKEWNVLNSLLKLSIPAMIGMFIMSINNIIDRIFVWHYIGPDALAWTTVWFPLFVLIIWLWIFIWIWWSTRLSINFGAKDTTDNQKIIWNVFSLWAIFAVIFTILWFIFLKPLLILSGASESSLPYAYWYMSIIILWSIFKILNVAWSSLIRSEWDAKSAMKIILLSSIVNIILNPIFIVVFKMWVEWIAISTVIWNFLSFLYVLYYYKKWISKFVPKLQDYKPKLNLIMDIMKLWFPQFLIQLFMVVQLTLYNNQLFIHWWDLAIWVMWVLFTSVSIVMMPMMWIAQWIQPILWYNHWANNKARILETLNIALLSSIIIWIFAYIIIFFFWKYIIMMFNTDAEFVKLWASAIKIFFLWIAFVWFQMILWIYYQSIWNSKMSFAVTTLRQFWILLPTLMILPWYYWINWVWISWPISDSIWFIVALIIYFRVRGNLISQKN